MEEKRLTPEDIFPYPFRTGQREMVRFLYETAVVGGAAVIESGTGTGKTISSLASSVVAAEAVGCKVIYLTRTKSQQKQIVTECSRISEKKPLVCAPIQGRSVSMCPMMSGNPELASGSPEELSKLCSEYKKKEDGICACRYFSNAENADILDLVSYVKEKHPTQEEFSEYCAEKEMCAYETMKRILPEADVIAAPYPFFFMPQILYRFTEWTGVSLESIIVVIDEAHNLPDYLREVMTSEYSLEALALAEKEAREQGDPEVAEGLKITDVTSVIGEIMRAATEYIIEDDGLIPPYFLQDELMERLGTTSRTISRIIDSFEVLGEIIIESKKQKKKLPRSYIGSLGRFLRNWYSTEDGYYVRLVTGGENVRFKLYCMDPREASRPLSMCHSSIHMSGTLAPLDLYVNELGLEDAETRFFASPFDPSNITVRHVEDISTKYDEMINPENLAALERKTVEIVKSVNRNTAVFFPSYRLMDTFIRDGVPDGIGRDIFFERRGMTQTDLMETVEGFRNTPQSVIFAVTGGRISEGLDFPDKDLEVAVLVGIPYPKPTAKHAAFTRYCDIRFGDGFEYASRIPAERKMRQAIGRLIRSENDVGAAIILDRRAAVMPGLNSFPTKTPCRDIADHFEKKEKHASAPICDYGTGDIARRG
ncbi:MAG: ATP-dependent DNA helicase [Candidatus Methanomethylophilaceae archaeon]|jgi:DNA excision repair protein ERCC-2